MKLAYIIVSHFNLEQTLRLYNRLNHKDSLFVFHVSKKCEPRYYEKLYAALKDRENCLFTKRVNITWGGYDLVQAVLNAIDTLVEKNADFDYAFFLSGQDYPIKPREHMVQMLGKNPGKQYMEVIPASDLGKISEWWEAYHFTVGKRRFWHPHQRKDNLLIALYNFIFALILPKNRQLPQGFLIYKGTSWWTLTRDCIHFMYGQVHSPEGKRIIKYFRNTWHQSELFFQTILMNSKYRDDIINDDLRFILWHENDDGHPKMLTQTDYDDIVSSDRLFARKFNSQVDAKILDLLDEKIAT